MSFKWASNRFNPSVAIKLLTTNALQLKIDSNAIALLQVAIKLLTTNALQQDDIDQQCPTLLNWLWVAIKLLTTNALQLTLVAKFMHTRLNVAIKLLTINALQLAVQVLGK
jgi:hypothetical protein